MTDRPIIFSAPMVRALLDGRKSQTRRIIKLQAAVGAYRLAIYDPNGEAFFGIGDTGKIERVRIPYSPGDRLWVRETALFWRNSHDNSLSHVAAFRADGYELEAGERWRSPIHMPRWASRLTLTVTDVRVQRLQEISGEDAVAEGVGLGPDQPLGKAGDIAARIEYRDLWNSLHGPGAWGANPWVAAISFTVRKGNIDEAPMPEGEG